MNDFNFQSVKGTGLLSSPKSLAGCVGVTDRGDRWSWIGSIVLFTLGNAADSYCGLRSSLSNAHEAHPRQDAPPADETQAFSQPGLRADSEEPHWNVGPRKLPFEFCE